MLYSLINHIQFGQFNTDTFFTAAARQLAKRGWSRGPLCLLSGIELLALCTPLLESRRAPRLPSLDARAAADDGYLLPPFLRPTIPLEEEKPKGEDGGWRVFGRQLKRERPPFFWDDLY